jgi:hypothetical protein
MRKSEVGFWNCRRREETEYDLEVEILLLLKKRTWNSPSKFLVWTRSTHVFSALKFWILRTVGKRTTNSEKYFCNRIKDYTWRHSIEFLIVRI